MDQGYEREETTRAAREAAAPNEHSFPRPSGAEFERRMGLRTALSSGACVLLILGYLSLVLELTSAQWGILARTVGISFPILLVPALFRNWQFNAPIRAWLDSNSPAGASAEAAYAALVRSPRHLFAQGVVIWVVGAGVVALVAAFFVGDFDPNSCVAMFVAGSGGGFVNSVFIYFDMKHSQRDLMSMLGEEVGDDRRDGVTRVSVRSKLLVGSGGITLVATGFAACLAFGSANAPIEANALRVMASSLAYEVARPELRELAAYDVARARLQEMGVATDLLVVDLEGHNVVWGDPGRLSAAELAYIQGSSGDSRGLASPNVFVWLPLGGSEVVVARLPWSAVRGKAGSMQTQLLLVFGIAAALSLLVVNLLARDLETSVSSIAESVRSVARGDLRRRLPLESEDELGGLAIACDEMAATLRHAVAGVIGTVDALELQAALISNDAMEVATGAGEQLRGVVGVTRAVEAVRDQASAIGASTEHLDNSVIDASSGVAEISASSLILDEMAEAFGVRINDTSQSVEELVRSVRTVGENTAQLSGAANSTAIRMRTMAAAMQTVSASAAEGVQLSERAVATAEEGRLRVQDTLEGMLSIRQATETASSVMSVLVGRVDQIDSILDVIDDVADETTLLALNAAIIAAQAGEHGRAFSVVADEIRELADRVLASTKEIAGVVHAVQAESLNAAKAIEQSTAIVSIGLDRSREADVALGEITRTSQAAGARISEIVAAVRLQSRDAEDVVSLMERVSEESAAIESAMGEQSRGNQFVLDAAIGMREISEQLKRTTAAQATGVSSVLSSIEGVGSSVIGIVESLQEQISACASVAESLKPVASGTTSHEATAQRLGSATHALREQANRLRAEVDRFVLE